MPPEVVINIFCQLPWFSDVFTLSAVCCRLRHVWLKNVNPVYKQIAPKSIPCERAARRFLIDQAGPGLGSPVSAKDVVCMVRNAGVIEKAILQFEREIVRRVRMDGLEHEGFYGGARNHPPTLTCTERTRFIRFYYSLWSLMRLDRSEWNSRLQEMTFQELYYLLEMTKLTQSIGREEIVPPPRYPHESSDSVHSINSGRSEKRIALEGMVWQQIQRDSWQFFEREAQNPIIYTRNKGFLWFVVLWDHWQPSLKDLVCHVSASPRRLSPAVQKQYFWNDKLDEKSVAGD